MGLFGGSKNSSGEQQQVQYRPQQSQNISPRRALSPEDQKVKELLYGITRPFFKNPLGHDDERKKIMYNYILCQQNEVIINLLNDISQKLDKLNTNTND